MLGHEAVGGGVKVVVGCHCVVGFVGEVVAEEREVFVVGGHGGGYAVWTVVYPECESHFVLFSVNVYIVCIVPRSLSSQ